MTDGTLPPDLRKVFGGPCEFRYGVMKMDQMPPVELPEIAFAGRSNVGKSSLINALLGRSIAHVSKTPGRTQQLNFFEVASTFYLVDMPGYGYAKVSKEKKENWDGLIRDYLRGRTSLRCVFVLIDSRRGLKDVDLDMMKMLDEAAVQYRIIMTKQDEPKPHELKELVGEITEALKKHAAAYPFPHPVSSQEKTGLEELQREVLTLV
jgi:GTP-binding protein